MKYIIKQLEKDVKSFGVTLEYEMQTANFSKDKKMCIFIKNKEGFLYRCVISERNVLDKELSIQSVLSDELMKIELLLNVRRGLEYRLRDFYTKEIENSFENLSLFQLNEAFNNFKQIDSEGA